MSKLRETIGAAVLDIEGDDVAIASTQRFFHLTIAKQRLIEVEAELSRLRSLQKERRELKKLIAELGAARGDGTP